jgi:hypothetical protein
LTSRSKPLIVGEAPSKNEIVPTPIEGRVGRRLARCAGLSFDEFIDRFDRMNLLSVRQDTQEKGFVFDSRAAGIVARELRERLEPGRTVLLLGHRVADAFGIKGEYFATFAPPGEAVYYVLPHPSGVNHWWNDPANVEKMNAFMHEIASR